MINWPISFYYNQARNIYIFYIKKKVKIANKNLFYWQIDKAKKKKLRDMSYIGLAVQVQVVLSSSQQVVNLSEEVR